MRILGLNFIQGTNIRNNQYDYSSQYSPVLKQGIQQDTFCRSDKIAAPAFTAKQEQISRDPLTKLYKEHLTCICCGRTMIDPKVIEDMRENHVFRCPTKDAIKILEKYENNMHTVEKSVFNLLKEQNNLYPDRSIQQHLIELKKTHEIKLIQKQVGIFKLIDKYAEKIKPELHDEIRTYLLDSFNTIKENGSDFSRIKFIKGLESILQNYPNTANKEKLIRLAGKLPTAYDDIDAFIVKYSKPKYTSENIAIRLLSYSMATIEHIHPQTPDTTGKTEAEAVKGANHLYNYVPECMRCNSFRSNKPMVYQLEDYPEMFINAQKAFDRYIDFAEQGKLSKMYIIKLYKALRQESEGVLDLDYSKLKLTKELRKELEKPFTYPINPGKKDVVIVQKPLPEPKTLPITIREGEVKELNVITPNDEVNSSTQIKEPENSQKEEFEIRMSPIISKKKLKRKIAQANNPQPKEKLISQKNKKTKENKETVRRNGFRR